MMALLIAMIIGIGYDTYITQNHIPKRLHRPRSKLEHNNGSAQQVRQYLSCEKHQTLTA